MKAYIDGVGVFAPCMANWTDAISVLSNQVRFDPRAEPSSYQSTLLPASEKRRASQTVKLALEVSQQAIDHALISPTEPSVVFASSTGDTQVLTDICETFTSTERLVSPIKFHNSVHNAPAGYWSIATQSHKPANSIAKYQETVASGLLEAIAQVGSESAPVLLSVYDVPFPEPLKTVEAIPCIFGASLVIQPHQTNQSLAAITVSYLPYLCQETVFDVLALEDIHQKIPAAKILSLLKLIALQQSGCILLPINESTLKIDVTYLRG